VGLFSFVGKALKGISKVAGFIPGIGGTISKVTGAVGGLLDHKKPMASPVLKAAGSGWNPMVMRGNSTQAGSGSLLTAQGMRSSPVLPGGAVATSSGPAPKMASPPRTFGGRSGTTRRKAKAKTRKKSTSTRRRTTRKLKFGSKAYRKKYLKHG
jgi:hypothetical protein